MLLFIIYLLIFDLKFIHFMAQNHYSNWYQIWKFKTVSFISASTCSLFRTTTQTISIFFYTFINCVFFRQTGYFCVMFTSIVNTIPTVVAHHLFYNKQNISRCAAHILATVTLSAKHKKNSTNSTQQLFRKYLCGTKYLNLNGFLMVNIMNM